MHVLSARTFFKRDRTRIDNFVFRLHYQWTVGLLICAVVIVAGDRFFGTTISCMTKGGPQASIINTHCLSQSTFTIPNRDQHLGTKVAAPGVSSFTEDMVHSFKYDRYYVWIPLGLIAHATFFYSLSRMWKLLENKRIKFLVDGVTQYILAEDADRNKLRDFLNEFFVKDMKHRDSYFYKYVFCEVFNLISILTHILVMNVYLNYRFVKILLEILNFSSQGFDEVPDSLKWVFPTQGKCTLDHVANNGRIQRVDAICELPMNMYHQIIYLFFICYLTVIFIVTIGNLIYRAIIIFSPELRFKLLMWSSFRVPTDELKVIYSSCGIGDWFILRLMKKNLKPAELYDKLLHNLHETIVDNSEIYNSADSL